MNEKTLPSQQVLMELFKYDPETGHFIRRKTVSTNAREGQVAGDLGGTGYWRITVSNVRYLAHRLAWMYMTGLAPTAEVDHVNGVRTDNRWVNLRVLTHAENLQNQRKAKSHSRSGILGVRQRGGKWVASISTATKRGIHLGTFATPEDAQEAYVIAKRELHAACSI